MPSKWTHTQLTSKSQDCAYDEEQQIYTFATYSGNTNVFILYVASSLELCTLLCTYFI